MRNMSRPQVVKLATELGAAYGGEDYAFVDHPYEERYGNFDYYGPHVWPGEHEESNSKWIISWENGPDEWGYAAKVSYLTEKISGGKFYAEPINSFTVAFYEV